MLLRNFDLLFPILYLKGMVINLLLRKNDWAQLESLTNNRAFAEIAGAMLVRYFEVMREAVTRRWRRHISSSESISGAPAKNCVTAYLLAKRSCWAKQVSAP